MCQPSTQATDAERHPAKSRRLPLIVGVRDALRSSCVVTVRVILRALARGAVAMSRLTELGVSYKS